VSEREVFVCESEKRKNETVKGIRRVGCGKLRGVTPLGPQIFFPSRQNYAISAALWSFHANNEKYANGVRLQDQFFKVVSFLLSMLMYYYYMQ
jgi:hypothetical protein